MFKQYQRPLFITPHDPGYISNDKRLRRQRIKTRITMISKITVTFVILFLAGYGLACLLST